MFPRHGNLIWLVFAGGMLATRAVLAFAITQPWQQTASGPALGPGQPLTLTWSLVPDGTSVAGYGESALVGWLDSQFGSAGSSGDLTQRPWFSLFASSFARWQQAGGIDFVYEPFDDGGPLGTALGELGVRGDIRLAGAAIDGIRGTLAFARQPDDGDLVLDTDGGTYLLDPADRYHRFRNVLMHEIGHVMGLDHIVSSDSRQLMEAQLDLTIDGPQHDDLRGVHYLFGDRWERAGRNETPATATDLGVLLPGALVEVGTAPFATPDSHTELDLVSIARRGDVDVFRFTVTTSGSVDIELLPRGATYAQALGTELPVVTNSVASSNLSFELLDGDGARRQLIDAAAAGLSESLRGVQIASGETLYVAVRGSRDNVQFYQLTLRMHAVVPEPNAACVLVCAIAGLMIWWRATVAHT